ncbi:5-hydroxytryptamine receptor 3A-like isoform X2 [Echeneis naucrates]|uniref:5-hydroxytryptamine receptor 3A-like n=2 Tax=Echeneis naucrates TaxID=173247 RepID=A0A665TQ54_ECHNA|nr:5-hydroxytryptamine receptor 3A-like isoform X2 [Echeneis naucrates]
MEYQTLSVNTKSLRLVSRLQATMAWVDPNLKWENPSNVTQVILPVDKIWTPDLQIKNGIVTTVEHNSKDLLVYRNGTVKHTVVIITEVNCEINLFNYPFAADECPILFHTLADDGCGTYLDLGDLTVVDSNHGDWETVNVVYSYESYIIRSIFVGLKNRAGNPFITLLLPSILIVLADAVSFALPLGGGERNCFKVTLVLSFTMFLVILNNQLPGDSKCSPVIRIHFCICLVLLVLSMLVSLVLTRLAKDGYLISCCFKRSKNKRDKEEKKNEDVKPDISVVHLNESEDTQMLRKMVNFLEAVKAKERKCERSERLANILDKAFFWLYFILGSGYFSSMIYVMVNHKCYIDNYKFWNYI